MQDISDNLDQIGVRHIDHNSAQRHSERRQPYQHRSVANVKRSTGFNGLRSPSRDRCSLASARSQSRERFATREAVNPTQADHARFEKMFAAFAVINQRQSPPPFVNRRDTAREIVMAIVVVTGQQRATLHVTLDCAHHAPSSLGRSHFDRITG
jgi:hypothetical protein